MPLDHIVIIGAGMIGASLAHDIKNHQLSSKLTAIDPDEEGGQFLVDAGIINDYQKNIDKNIADADLFLLAAPPSKFADIARSIAPFLKQGCILMDVGSVKKQAIKAIAEHIPDGVIYMPAHPIAGSDKSGAEAGVVGLFENKRIILTPYNEISEDNISKILSFWENIGGICEIMDADKHDLIYAHTSHLPQIIAYLISIIINERSASINSIYIEKTNKYLRIGGSSPELWLDILLANKEHVVSALKNYIQIISHMVAELQAGVDVNEDSSDKIDLADDSEILFSLFPRVISSCLISTVQLCEHKQDIKLFPYIGSGFADMSAPAMEAPDGDMEKISASYVKIAELLKEFEKHMRQICIYLQQNNSELLYGMLKDCHQSHSKIMKNI